MSIENALTSKRRAFHLRAQGDLLKGAYAAKYLKFDFEKFENSIIPLKGACAPMLGNRVCCGHIKEKDKNTSNFNRYI